ncbi:MAG: 7-cyano-7-deazaguanine synthase [Candidatus Schekmanbacteria bacterium]|nr:7-cyano-7-deazaguanine synthase [Candidatus Schekmanbacteria bacterium]
MKIKALALLSGGLDSTLAVKVIQEQGVEVSAINFVSPFCLCTSKKRGCLSEASRVCDELGVELKVVYVGKDYLDVIRKPKFGYGKNMNPCIDCRIHMHTIAKKHMEEIGAQFIISGEVLGQRPMSQRRDSMNIIDRESGLKGILLRPLSAKHFPITIPEEKGWVDREKLPAITGRSRKKQFELAEELGINDYPCPAGGCLLTDFNFSIRLRDLFNNQEDVTVGDINLLKTGRHFRLAHGAKFVIGRSEVENIAMRGMLREGDVWFEPVDVSGPSGLLRAVNPDDFIEISASIIARYSKENNGKITVSISRGADGETSSITVSSASQEFVEGTMVS